MFMDMPWSTPVFFVPAIHEDGQGIRGGRMPTLAQLEPKNRSALIKVRVVLWIVPLLMSMIFKG